MPGWIWFLGGLATGGVLFYGWLAWYFRDSFR